MSIMRIVFIEKKSEVSCEYWGNADMFISSLIRINADDNLNFAFTADHISLGARRMRLKSWHLLQPIGNLSFVCFNWWNFIPSKILSSNIISCKFNYNANGIFIFWEFCRSCLSSVFLLGARVHILLPGTLRYVWSTPSLLSHTWGRIYSALLGQKEATHKSPKSEKVMFLDWN